MPYGQQVKNGLGTASFVLGSLHRARLDSVCVLEQRQAISIAVRKQTGEVDLPTLEHVRTSTPLSSQVRSTSMAAAPDS